MNLNDAYEYFEELDDLDQNGTNQSNKKTSKRRESRKLEADANLFVRAQEVAREFKFTYKAARFEEAWLLSSLSDIAEHQWVSDVLRKVKGGKEASVYLCRTGLAISEAEFVAAKVYRPRTLRNLKNDQIYRAGRIDLADDGKKLFKEADVNAIIKRTAYGEELRHTSWIAYEFNTLETLHAAGADVPKPYAMSSNVIVMGFVGGNGAPAPTLSEIALEPSEARLLFDRVLRNIEIMLAHERIHGDLSAYNILYWDGDIKLIDFPQVTIPEANPSAWVIFLRDMTRVCQYFQSQGVRCDARKLAVELWTSHGHKVIEDVHPRHLDAEKKEDRRLWEKQKSR